MGSEIGDFRGALILEFFRFGEDLLFCRTGGVETGGGDFLLWL